ncbi:hypothetical protein CP973_00400 [Streptomyces albofaciens JCM 4342]|uniref:hypothetical protein n=1 Tax=Streptomyces albofaciens TaxID=66866 RepID=UPI00123BC38F|nr:hypothetical protein [Streptomyces albofaciens]KAA6220660.1 hypothetical protein CP973_00400 [Streptomyces albofaciens JCM 4342]
MFEKVGAEESARLEALASKVRDELAAAGLPVLAPGLNHVLAGGAEVEVDEGDDAAGGVYVDWQAGPRLRECASRALRLGLMDEPVLRRPGQISAAMMHAMAAILSAAGFTVEDPDDEYRPHHLRVVDGPAPGVTPAWWLREEEVDLSGWQAAGADTSTGAGAGADAGTGTD